MIVLSFRRWNIFFLSSLGFFFIFKLFSFLSSLFLYSLPLTVSFSFDFPNIPSKLVSLQHLEVKFFSNLFHRKLRGPQHKVHKGWSNFNWRGNTVHIWFRKGSLLKTTNFLSGLIVFQLLVTLNLPTSELNCSNSSWKKPI